MNDTPRTDAEHAQFPMGGFTLDFARKLERELTAAREEIEMLNIRYGAAAMHHDNNMGEVMDQRDRLAEALQKLADCDWVITPHDRMDAVRTIAREALQSLTPNEL